MAEDKIRIAPDHFVYTDEDHTRFSVEVDLPGVKKDDITFKMRNDSFYLSATTGEKHYLLYHATCHPVKPKEAIASYVNGHLKVEVPFKDFQKGAVNVDIK